MMSNSRLPLIASVALLLCSSVAYAFSAASVFSGRTLQTYRVCKAQSTSSRSYLEMKGKGVPQDMKGQQRQMQDMQEMKEQMANSQTPGPDGLPVFNMFVRSKSAKVWYPCGSFRGDDGSKTLAMSWRDDGLLSGVSKNQLDTGVGNSLAEDINKLNESIFRQYKQLRKSKDSLEYGYKLAFEGLSEEQKKMNIIVPEKMDGIMDNVKSKASGFFDGIASKIGN
mmetsp:Transcript_49589/g.57904  ORF Transcript_49589/g.57904 Transcript_49589/m.57904 type:complete len:224 (+) Transcript_49589:55-726(+)